MDFAVQIYGCMREFRKNPAQFFTKMKQAAVTQIEPCIFFDDPIAFRLEAEKRGDSDAAALPDLLWLPVETPAFAKELREQGLTMRSAHAIFSSVKKCGDKMLETAVQSGITAYVAGTPAWALTNPEAYLDELQYLSDALDDMGVQLWLHNSGAEITAKKDGVSVYRWLLDHCEKLYAQPDTGWVHFGGENPAGFIAGLGDKLKALHFKDLHPSYQEKTGNDIFAVLGQGCVNQQAVLALAPDDGSMPLIIDQDASRGDFFADIAQSVAALQAWLNQST